MTTHQALQAGHADHPRATITADPHVPAIHITRDFAATPAQLKDVSPETLHLEDLGDGRTRLHAQSLCDAVEGAL